MEHRSTRRLPFTEHDALCSAQDRANAERRPIAIYRGIMLGSDAWYIRAKEDPAPFDAPLFVTVHPQTVCGNCGQWQRGNGDCLNACKRRGFA